jgi:hypothetical protein
LSFISLFYSLDYVCSPGHRSTTPKALVTLITCENMHVGYCPFVAERVQQKKQSLSTDSSMSVGNLAETSNWVVISHCLLFEHFSYVLGGQRFSGHVYGVQVDTRVELQRRIASRTGVSLADYRYLGTNRDRHILKHGRTVEPLYKDILWTSDLISTNKKFVGKHISLRRPCL